MTQFKLTAAILTAFSLLAAPIVGTAPALAYDADVDWVCDTYDGEDYCVTVDQLRAECPILDPDNELEICAGLNEDKTRPAGVKSYKAAASKSKKNFKSVRQIKKLSASKR